MITFLSGVPDFGSTAQTGAGDFDGDGQNNAAELAAGTIPNDGTPFFGITVNSRGGNAVDILFSSVSGMLAGINQSLKINAFGVNFNALFKIACQAQLFSLSSHHILWGGISAPRYRKVRGVVLFRSR